MVSYWKCVGRPDGNSRIWGYFFIGVAIGVLAKGPIGAIFPGMSIFVWMATQREWLQTWRRLPWITGTILTLLLVVPWYALAEVRTPGFLHYFIIGEHFERFLVPHWSGDLYGSGRPQPRGTIWLFGLIATLPWWVALLFVLVRPIVRRQPLQMDWLRDRWLSYLLLWLLAPLVLFTFATNILITYVATSLVAFALLAAHAFRRLGEAPDRYGLTITAGVVPVLFLVLVIAVTIDPDTRYLRTQAGIIATYKKLTAGRPSEIIYAFHRPYSAEFYTGGKAKFVDDSNKIAVGLDKGEPYFVVPEEFYPKLPAICASGWKCRLHDIEQ